MKKRMISVGLMLTLAVGSVFAGSSTIDTTVAAKNSTTEEKKQPVKVSTVVKAVKKAYGENYFATETLSKAKIKEKYGLTTSMYSEVSAQEAAITLRVDTFIAVKAKKGKAKTVENALKKYQKKLKEDTLQYPMNIPKIKASRVDRIGDYVFFTMLGYVDTDKIGDDDAKILKAYKDQNKIAYNTIKKTLNK